MKTIVIIDGKGGRLANQLWLYAAVYAFCLEKKYVCKNYYFFRYAKYFNHKQSILGRCIAGLPRQISLVLYQIYTAILKIVKHQSYIDYEGSKEFLLPPSTTSEEAQQQVLAHVTTPGINKIYLGGWLFRNPVGLSAFHTEIVEYFKPQQKYYNTISSFMQNLRTQHTKLVGVHIRHGDYKVWNDGKFYYSFQEVRAMLDEFLASQQTPQAIGFIICSDEKIDHKALRV
jgi:hypothetical protein